MDWAPVVGAGVLVSQTMLRTPKAKSSRRRLFRRAKLLKVIPGESTGQPRCVEPEHSGFRTVWQKTRFRRRSHGGVAA